MGRLQKFYLLSIIGIFVVSIYPMYMGVKVVRDYIMEGTVRTENYPKYIIPYTPICIALMIAVVIAPLIIKFFEKIAIYVISLISIITFFVCELWFENLVVFDGSTKTNVESWQAFMCYATPEAMQKTGNILLGEYSPSFKIHFYIISVVIILTVLNCIIRFAIMIKKRNYDKKKPLMLQAISTTIFIGLCIFACFTAFFRTGELQISFVSALLMSVFFIVFGVTFGIYMGSFLYKKRKMYSVIIPSFIAMITTIIMYIGELILLNGYLFQYGRGLMFDRLKIVPFAIIDIIVILSSGLITYFIMLKFSNKENS